MYIYRSYMTFDISILNVSIFYTSHILTLVIGMFQVAIHSVTNLPLLFLEQMLCDFYAVHFHRMRCISSNR